MIPFSYMAGFFQKKRFSKEDQMSHFWQKATGISGLSILMLFVALQEAGATRSLWEKECAELVRFTVLEAEATLNNGAGSFVACIVQWKRLSQLLLSIDDPELRARIELLRLLYVKRSLELIPRRPVPELEAWLNSQSCHIYFCGEECYSWMVKPEVFWDLHDKFPDLVVTDDLGWAAATNPRGHGCEGSASCELSKWNASMGEYLKRHPQGKYVFLAIEKLMDICEEIQAGKLSVDELATPANLQEAIESVSAVGGSRQLGYFRHVRDMLESTGNLLHKAKELVRAKDVSFPTSLSILKDPLDNWLDDWYRPRKYFDKDDLQYYWREIGKIIPAFEEEQLVARAKFLRLLCLKRMLALLNEHNGIPNDKKWWDEVREYCELGAVKSELFWELGMTYTHLPIADDIAWVAANNIEPSEDAFGPDLYHQLIKLDMTMMRYLRTFPDGKYARIALSRIVSFFQSCRGEDRLMSPPRGFSEGIYVHGPGKEVLGRISETLRLVSGLNEGDQIAEQAMADFLRTFKQSSLE
jgi:hypothetical protein